MDKEDWNKLQKNFEFIKKNLKVRNILDKLISRGIVDDDDEQRIENAPTDSEKAHTLLKILKGKSPGKKAFKFFCDALKSTDTHIAERIESTPVDSDITEEDAKRTEDVIRQILLSRFVNKTGASCTLEEMKTVIQDGVGGEDLKCDWDATKLREFVEEVFTNVEYEKGKKGKLPQFTNIGLKIVHQSSTSSQSSHMESDSLSPKYILTSSVPTMTVEALCDHLKPKLVEKNIPLDILDVFKESDISGDVFLSLSEEDIEKLFPTLSFGNRRRLYFLTKDGAKPTSSSDHSECFQQPHEASMSVTSSLPSYKESLRKFDAPIKTTDKYFHGRVVDILGTTRGKMIRPMKSFFHFEEDENLIQNIARKTVIFSSACLNERQNGTLYFGIAPEATQNAKAGQIIGLVIDKKACSDMIMEYLKGCYKPEQLPIALQAIRDPKYIDVVQKDTAAKELCVVEVDVVPDSAIVKNEMFLVKTQMLGTPKKKGKTALYRCIDGTVTLQNHDEVVQFMECKESLTSVRKNQEERDIAPKLVPDKRQRFLNLFTGGSEKLEDDIYPILLLSPLDRSMDMGFIEENLSFAKFIDAKAVFDFDPKGDTAGLYKYLDTHEQVLQVLTTDNFDKNGRDDNVKKSESHTNFLDALRASSRKTWIFCNGYECMEKNEMDAFAWKQNRIEGFKEAVKFHYDDIPHGRAVVLIFLFCKNYEVMLEAADEIVTRFRDQWIVLAEKDTLADLWKEQMLQRHCADKKTLDERCIIGIPWSHLNHTILQVAGPRHVSVCELPTSTGAYCRLRERNKNDMCDLQILSRNECDDIIPHDNEEERGKIRLHVEETFYRGGEVGWSNFWYGEDHVLKRDCHRNLMEEVRWALTADNEEDKVGIVILMHQPGSGGTTTARQILWDLREEYRCCIIDKITDESCEQIANFRSYEDPEIPKPPVILFDNQDEDKVAQLHAELEDKARIIARRSEHPFSVFCVLILCIRRAELPYQFEGRKVLLKQELSEREHSWFEKKNTALINHYQMTKSGVDPKYLISFNILKHNFNKEYIKTTVESFVKGVTNEKEQEMLKYLSLLNTYDVDFCSVPVSCFDTVMGNSSSNTTMTQQSSKMQRQHHGQKQMQVYIRRTGWETSLSSPLKVLLNRSSKSAGQGSKIQALRIFNKLLSHEILLNLQKILKQSVIDIMKDFLESSIFQRRDGDIKQLTGIVKNIFKKRNVLPNGYRDKFSPFILAAMKDVDLDSTAVVMTMAFNMTDDAFIAQQISRFYMHCQNWKQAEHFAKAATNSMYNNSFLWDTYAQVFKEQISVKLQSIKEGDDKLDNMQAKEIIKLAGRAIQLFRKEQSISQQESRVVNNAGYFGEVRVILLVLNFFPKFQCYDGEDIMHRFLVDENFTPENLSFMGEENIDSIKRMSHDSNRVLRRLEDEYLQLKTDTFGEFQLKDFNRNKESLIGLKENLEIHFGEESDVVPPSLSQSDASDYRRRRVRRIGLTSLHGALSLRTKPDGQKKLQSACSLMFDNVHSAHCTAFDVVTLLNASIAYNATAHRATMPAVQFQQLIDWSIKLYDMRESQDRPCLETYLYLVLFNLATEQKRGYHICHLAKVTDAIKEWKETFNKNYPKQKEGEKYCKKKDTTLFFLGKGKEMDEFVYYDDLRSWQGSRRVHGERVWRDPQTMSKLRRMEGSLKFDGLEVNMQLETPGGNKFTLSIPTSIPIVERALWQKKVFFFLGFAWSGPKAYDITHEDLSLQSTIAVPSQKTKGWNITPRSPPTTFRTLPEIVKDIHDTASKLEELAKRRKKKKRDWKSQDSARERDLQDKMDRLVRERDELLGGPI